MGQDDLAQGKKNATRLGASLVFLDESGLLMAPLVRRTWASPGSDAHSPAKDQFLSESFRDRHAGRISAKRSSPVDLPASSQRQHKRGIGLIVSPASAVSRPRPYRPVMGSFLGPSGQVRSSLFRSEKGMALRVPAPYAPELNPVENVWCYLKTNSMANETNFDLEMLTAASRRHGR